MGLVKATMIYEEPAVKQSLKRLDRTSERSEWRRKAWERSAEIQRWSVRTSEHIKKSQGREQELIGSHILQGL